MPYVSIERNVLADQIAHLRMRREQNGAAPISRRQQDRRVAGHVALELVAVERIVDRKPAREGQFAESCCNVDVRPHQVINRPVVVRHFHRRRTTERQRTLAHLQRHHTDAALQVFVRIEGLGLRGAGPARPSHRQVVGAAAGTDGGASLREKVAHACIGTLYALGVVDAPVREPPGQDEQIGVVQRAARKGRAIARPIGETQPQQAQRVIRVIRKSRRGAREEQRDGGVQRLRLARNCRFPRSRFQTQTRNRCALRRGKLDQVIAGIELVRGRTDPPGMSTRRQYPVDGERHIETVAVGPPA